MFNAKRKLKARKGGRVVEMLETDLERLERDVKEALRS